MQSAYSAKAFAAKQANPTKHSSPTLVSLNEACRMTSLSRTAINRWRALGFFPAAVPLGERRVAFVRAEVEQWIIDRISGRDRDVA